MWYMIIYLTCLGVVHLAAQKCKCPETKADGSQWSFVIHAEVLKEGDAGYFDNMTMKVYDIKNLETLKTQAGKTIGNKVYTSRGTDGRTGPCGAALENGKEYILKGNFTDDGGKPFITSCGYIPTCNKPSYTKDLLKHSTYLVAED
ncbi:hypothetical protein ANCCAN_09665 [Ancylostoma caninum]|uniref:Transthyretin-like family protein n=1 Tax=Ancylostoma caninum TaxID=29170 RepID=A0A368GIV8_ANCCA|nr:hypothetical protein ANCCAN_09665 [Ancylostoma caninum]